MILHTVATLGRIGADSSSFIDGCALRFKLSAFEGDQTMEDWSSKWRTEKHMQLYWQGGNCGISWSDG